MPTATLSPQGAAGLALYLTQHARAGLNIYVCLNLLVLDSYNCNLKHIKINILPVPLTSHLYVFIALLIS